MHCRKKQRVEKNSDKSLFLLELKIVPEAIGLAILKDLVIFWWTHYFSLVYFYRNWVPVAQAHLPLMF